MNTPYIGFFRRAAALIIDVIICVAAWLLPSFLLSLVSQMLSLVWLFTIVPIYWLYFACQESCKYQATLGKRLLHIKVIGKDGNRISFARATGRTFARILSDQILRIGFVMAGCTHRNRALHDFIAETYVVRADFQPGDELPDTPNHPVWLAIWSLALVLFFMLFAVSGLIYQRYMPYFQAAIRLQQLAAQEEPFTNPLEEDGNRYYRHADGYRVLLNDENHNTLFFGNDARMVCCEETEEKTCKETGFKVCQK